MSRVCKFLDTTLRDGEQTIGVAFSEKERFDIALKLDEMGVDIIETGFAASGKNIISAMKKISRYGLKAKTISLARPIESDIDCALRAEVDGVILVTGFSNIHLKYKFNKTKEQILEQLLNALYYAKSHGLYVQISNEDGTRTENDVITEVSSICYNNGADKYCISDTVGIATPECMVEKINAIKKGSNIPIGVHCHNDFGLASINSVISVLNGASSIAVTMNGLGERTGNASLEQCAMILKLLYNYDININIKNIFSTAKYIEHITKMPINPMSPVIGENCFKHESGIHIDAILKNPACYEAYSPSILNRERELVIGKTNGRHSIKHFTEIIGENLTLEQCEMVLNQVKNKSDDKTQISFNDLKEMITLCKRA